jgi:mono/diheme cytochrome c family protein
MAEEKTGMSRATWIFAAACLALAVAARAQESPAAQRGHNLYEQYCMDCHGLKGQGDGVLAEELKVAPADLTTIAARRKGVFPDVEIREIIDGRRRVRAHGPQNMPLWGKALGMGTSAADHEAEVRDKINALLDYLKSIQRK